MLSRRLIPVASSYDGDAFFTVENGRRVATPLLLVLAVVELSDVVFAVDSIPAVSISADPGWRAGCCCTCAQSTTAVRAAFCSLWHAQGRICIWPSSVQLCPLLQGIQLHVTWPCVGASLPCMLGLMHMSWLDCSAGCYAAARSFQDFAVLVDGG